MIEEGLVTLSLPYSGETKKTVRVFVPAHEQGERLPVIYMTDGQNIFEDGNPGQFGCWYTREAVREKYQTSGKQAVIVGIHNDEGMQQRFSDLTPESIGELKYPDGMPEQLRKMMIPKGEVFEDFVINTLMPAVAERFPVKTDRDSTAFCGSSSGGVMAYYIALKHPDRFCMSGVFSPAFPVYSTESIIDWTSSLIQENMPYLYFYSGGTGELESEICDRTEKVYDSLVRIYPAGCIGKTIRPEQPHNESAWQPVFKELLDKFIK